MKIKLKQTWFAPGGKRYRRGIHDVPDDMFDALPSSIEVLSKDEVAEQEPERDLLREADILRANADAEEQLLREAEEMASKRKSKKATADE